MYASRGPARQRASGWRPERAPERSDDSECRLSLSRKPVRYRHVWPGVLLLAALALLLVGLLRWGDHFLSPGPSGGIHRLLQLSAASRPPAASAAPPQITSAPSPVTHPPASPPPP